MNSLLVEKIVDHSQSASAEARGSKPHACGLPKLAIVVPCFNEFAGLTNLKAGLERVRRALADGYHVDVLLVDDGSTDDTVGEMRRSFAGDPQVTVIEHPVNRGIAAAIATGLAHTDAEIVASLDADCTYDPLQLVGMLEQLGPDVDMVVASPYHPQGSVEGVPRWRLQLSQTASRMYRCLLRNKLHTYTSCVRVYRRSSVVDIELDNAGFVGVVELVWQLDRRGGKIVEHPAVLTVRSCGASKMRVAKTTLCHLRLLARAAWLRVLGPAPPQRSTAARQPTNSSSCAT